MTFDGQIEAKLEIGSYFANRYLRMHQHNVSRRTSDNPAYIMAADYLFARMVKFDLGRFGAFSERDEVFLGMLDFRVLDEVGVDINSREMLKEGSKELLKVLEERGLEGFLQYLGGLV